MPSGQFSSLSVKSLPGYQDVDLRLVCQMGFNISQHQKTAHDIPLSPPLLAYKIGHCSNCLTTWQDILWQCLIIRWCPCTSVKAGFQYMSWLLQKTNVRIPNTPPFLLISLTFYIWADIIWYGISLWSICVSCPGYVLSQNLAHPQPTGPRRWGDVGGTALMLCQRCSAIAKTLVCSQNLSGSQCRAWCWEGCYGGS